MDTHSHSQPARDCLRESVRLSFQGPFLLTSLLFTTCRSRPKGGAGMSAPFTIYLAHNPRGQPRPMAAAQREMACYLMASARAGVCQFAKASLGLLTPPSPRTATER